MEDREHSIRYMKDYIKDFEINLGFNSGRRWIPEPNGKCVTVVASTGLHFRAFYLLTFAASHDLKETIDKDYCECGMPLGTVVRESESPLKERSERV